MPVNAVDDLGGGGADCFKGTFQLRKLPPAAPPGDIPKGIIGSVKPVVLAYRVSDTFRLNLTGAAVGSFPLFLLRGVKVNVVQLRVGDLMDSGL